MTLLAAEPDENSLFLRRGERGALFEPLVERFQCFPADRHDPVLGPLAGHANQPVGSIDIRQAQARQFGKPETRRVEQLENGPVAAGKISVGDINFEQLSSLICAQRPRQRTFQPGCSNTHEWIAGMLPLTDQTLPGNPFFSQLKIKQLPCRRQCPLDRSAGKTETVKVYGEGPGLGKRQLLEIGYILLVSKGSEFLQVPPISVDSIGRKPPLIAQVFKKCGNRLFWSTHDPAVTKGPVRSHRGRPSQPGRACLADRFPASRLPQHRR